MDRWLQEAYTSFKDIFNCLDEEYFFWDEQTIREITPDLDAQIDNMKYAARNHCVLEGVKLEDRGGKVSVVVGNFMKSCYIPFLVNQLSRQTLSPDRFEIIFVDSADDPAFLPVVRFCHHRWPNLTIRAFETHEDRTKTVTVRRNVGARQARNDIIIMFDSDWLPIGENFLRSLVNTQQHIGQNHGGRSMVRGTPFWITNCGEANLQYGRQLRGPSFCFDTVKKWQMYPQPVFKVVHERNDHDFVFAITTNDYHKTRGFPENCVGGSGIEDRFFNRFLLPLGVPWGWAVDAWAANLTSLPTFSTLERCFPFTTQPCGESPNDESWGKPETLENLTLLLD